MNGVLLTGANGFLGSILGKGLETRRMSVVTLGKGNGDYICDLSSNTPQFERDFKWVIHVAGRAHLIPKNRQESKEFYDNNLGGTINLIKGLELTERLPEALFFISTVSVYGLDEGENIDEDHPLNGTSPYADSKRKAEEFLINWGKENGVKIGILRLPLVSGPNPPGNLGAMINGIKSGRYFRINGNRSRKSMLNGKDLVNVLEPLAIKGGIYNLTDGFHLQIHDLEEVIAEVYKKKVKTIPKSLARIAAKTGDIIGNGFPINSDRLRKLTSTLTFSDEKARRELEWNPTSVLDYLGEIL